MILDLLLCILLYAGAILLAILFCLGVGIARGVVE